MEGKYTDDLRRFAGRFDIYEPVKVLWFGYIEKVVFNRNNLILNPLFNFETMKELEYRGDVEMFGSADNGTCKSFLICGRRLI